jgi:hypothetical protein
MVKVVDIRKSSKVHYKVKFFDFCPRFIVAFVAGEIALFRRHHIEPSDFVL